MRIHADINLGATIKQEDAKRQTKTANRLLELLNTQPGIILADEVGMGKTFVALATALSYVANLTRNRRILILTPSIELKDKWDKDIDTFRDYCIKKDSKLKRIAQDRGIESIKELFQEKDTPILTIPLSRVVGAPKEEEMLCYLGAYFRRKGFSSNKRKEILGRVGYDLRIFNELARMNPDSWFDEKFQFLDYENVKKANFDIFDSTIRDNGTEKEFKNACRLTRYSLIPKFPICIVDEAHNYKNSKVMGRRFFDSQEETECVPFKKFLFLTATPFQLGHEELLSIFQMFKAAETCPQGYEENLDALSTHLQEYTKKIESLENCWHKFSKSRLDEEQNKVTGLKDISECGDPELREVHRNAIKEKEKLQSALKQYIVRNTKDKSHREVIVGACSKESPGGLNIPDKDRPLFYSLLRLQDEMEQDEDIKSKASWLTDSMVTSTYSTLKESKMLKSIEDGKHNSMMIGKYQRIVSSLIPNDDSKHPKVADLVEKVVDRYFMGEKSLIFTFYIETAKTLEREIRKQIKVRNDKDLKGKNVANPSKYKKYVKEGLTKADDLKYLAFHENLVLTYNRTPKKIDFLEFARILGRNGFNFDSGKVNYKILLRAYEHYVISQNRKGVPDEIAEIVSNEEYVHAGLRPDKGKKKQYQVYEPTTEHMKRLKESRALKYLVKGPNIWQSHTDLLRKVEDIDLRRNIQSIIISELLKSDFIIAEFAKKKLSEEAADETWLEVICETYNKKEIFNQSFRPETTCQRVERWIKYVIAQYEHAADAENKTTVVGKLKSHRDNKPADVSAIHGRSNVDRSAYFDAFNSPFKPNVLICTSIGSEGIDLQHECSAVFLYDLGWNPSAIEQKIGRIDRIGSKSSRELDEFKKTQMKTISPVLGVYRPFIKGTRDERMHRVLQHREKWFNFILGSGQRLSDNDDENGDFAQLAQIQNEEEMLPLPDSLAKDLFIDLSV
jgi:ERCC4-related helicase